MYFLHKTFLVAHLLVGAVSLVVFWLPLLAKKGSEWHRRCGRWFDWTMTGVVLTALALALTVLVDPIGVRFATPDLDATEAERVRNNGRMAAMFLLMLSGLVYVSLRQGAMAVRYKLDRSPLRRFRHVAPVSMLLVLTLPVGVAGYLNDAYLLMIFAGISLLASVGTLRYVFARDVAPRAWLAEHLGGYIGAGIGAYTAFFAFGGSRVLAELLPGRWQLVPWLIPAVVGTIAIRRLNRRYETRRAEIPTAARSLGNLR